MKPLGNHLLIEPLPQKSTTEAGILLPPTDNHMYFRVLDIGPKVQEIAKGDHIVMHSFQGHQAELDDGRKIVNASGVLAVL